MGARHDSSKIIKNPLASLIYETPAVEHHSLDETNENHKGKKFRPVAFLLIDGFRYLMIMRNVAVLIHAPRFRFRKVLDHIILIS